MNNALDFNKIKTIPIAQRKNKTKLSDFADPRNTRPILKSKEIDELARRIAKSRKEKNPVVFMIGAHVVKVGMGALLIDLMKKGVIKHIAMNGACPIHDFELALIGETSDTSRKP